MNIVIQEQSPVLVIEGTDEPIGGEEAIDVIEIAAGVPGPVGPAGPQGPQGPPGSAADATDRTYVHSQITPSNLWIAQHNLGKYPAVTIVDSAGSQVIGEVIYIDVNTVELHFTDPFGGQAFFN